MLSREERKNMINFIVNLYGVGADDFIYMTDTDVEGMYEKVYYEVELQRDI
ncbi:BH0509 family protein [Ammoniphilus sp. CFH 90114]|uniref:BH0509 family protein n=1 Tax=Ammoniphilus sp. CFH 90114 TaxID=2493665 RepID=UPI00100E585D|nr:BH0509 family protein [Ammoniphilus sp. CFH 90114]RXT13746.1 BH0509 family protein [Ammoniphilus sp. CFH 90114]